MNKEVKLGKRQEQRLKTQGTPQDNLTHTPHLCHTQHQNTGTLLTSLKHP